MSEPLPDSTAHAGAARVRRTFRLDCLRQSCSGVLESAAQTFLLLIAVREFDAGALDKAAIAAGVSVGLLVSPLVLHWTRRLRATPASMAGRLLGLGAVACVVMALQAQLWVFVTASVLALATMSVTTPLITQIYQDSYPSRRRGELYARAQMVRIATAMAFAYAGGVFLTAWPGGWPVLLALFGAAFFGAGRAVSAMPAGPLEDTGLAHPLKGFGYVRSDRVFRHTLVVWMFMGFANLMIAPLRVEYLANPSHGISMDPADVALLTAVVPNAVRLATTHYWGVLFDRMNFFLMRMLLNTALAAAMLLFFTAGSWAGWLISALIHGMAVAGADVAWSLWVTKIARPEHVADYMSVHTFLTGLRGLLAPVVGFLLIERIAPGMLAAFCAGLIVLSTLMLVPDYLRTRPRRSG